MSYQFFLQNHKKYFPSSCVPPWLYKVYNTEDYSWIEEVDNIFAFFPPVTDLDTFY